MATAKTKGKGGARVIDLDSARAARAEKRGDVDSPRIRFSEEDFDLPLELPADFVLLVEEGRFRDGIKSLFSEADAERFFAHQPSMDDLEQLAESLFDTYGVDEGK
jgi:hypothetical protein